MKKSVLLVAILLLSFSLIGCENTAGNEATEQGKVELKSKEYDKALSSFEEAISEGSEDEETKKLVKIIKDFKNGKKLIEEEKFKEAKKVLDSIHKDYVNYSIKDDVDGLKKSIITYEKNNEYVDNGIVYVEQLINENKYQDAKTKLEEILYDELPISEIQKEKIDQHTITVDQELVKIEVAESKRVEKERAQKEKLEKEKAESEEVVAKLEEEKTEQKHCLSNHYVDKEDFIEIEGRCKGCSIDRTLTSSSSLVDCPNCGAVDSINRKDGICSDCNTKVIPAIVGLENDGTIIYDDGTRGREDHNFF